MKDPYRNPENGTFFFGEALKGILSNEEHLKGLFPQKMF